MKPVRRVVTGHRGDKAVVLFDSAAPNQKLRQASGLVSTLLWVTDERPADVSGSADRSLREIGVGDLSVGKHVKRMTHAFYGRVISYEAGLAGTDSALAAALARNVFGTISAPDSAAAMAAYVRSAVSGLRSQPADDLLAGTISFTTPSSLTGDTG